MYTRKQKRARALTEVCEGSRGSMCSFSHTDSSPGCWSTPRSTMGRAANLLPAYYFQHRATDINKMAVVVTLTFGRTVLQAACLFSLPLQTSIPPGIFFLNHTVSVSHATLNVDVFVTRNPSRIVVVCHC